jgi:hypothetical protein
MRKLVLLSVLGLAFSVSAAMANDDTAPVRERDDAQFFCEFHSEFKKDGKCEVFGQFDARKRPRHNEVIRGDRDDFLKVVCEDCDDDHDRPIYHDGIEWLLRRDADDSREIVDTEFRGVHGLPSVQVDDLNWKDLDRNSYRATLTYEKRHTGELVRLVGRCEFRKREHSPR